jgi:hypothetical protein
LTSASASALDENDVSRRVISTDCRSRLLEGFARQKIDPKEESALAIISSTMVCLPSM